MSEMCSKIPGKAQTGNNMNTAMEEKLNENKENSNNFKSNANDNADLNDFSKTFQSMSVKEPRKEPISCDITFDESIIEAIPRVIVADRPLEENPILQQYTLQNICDKIADSGRAKNKIKKEPNLANAQAKSTTNHFDQYANGDSLHYDNGEPENLLLHHTYSNGDRNFSITQKPHFTTVLKPNQDYYEEIPFARYIPKANNASVYTNDVNYELEGFSNILHPMVSDAVPSTCQKRRLVIPAKKNPSPTYTVRPGPGTPASYYVDYGVSRVPIVEYELPDADMYRLSATNFGTLLLNLRHGIRIDMTLDRAIRIFNLKDDIVACVSASGSASALLHPNGRVYQYGSRVEILAIDQHTHNNKFAKMWHKGVSFSSDQCAVVFLVDSAGTRTTTDTFSDLTQDFSLSMFYEESRYGPQYVPKANDVLQNATYWTSEDETEHWIVNNIKISQTFDGLVRVGRELNKYSLRMSSNNGSANVSTPFVHCTGSLGQTSHLFVRRGERRMHYDGRSFILRNAGHSAGFDEKNQLKVY